MAGVPGQVVGCALTPERWLPFLPHHLKTLATSCALTPTHMSTDEPEWALHTSLRTPEQVSGVIHSTKELGSAAPAVTSDARHATGPVSVLFAHSHWQREGPGHRHGGIWHSTHADVALWLYLNGYRWANTC